MEIINDIAFDSIRLAYGFPDGTSIEDAQDCARKAECQGFIYNDRMYPVRSTRISMEMHEAPVAATKTDFLQ